MYYAEGRVRALLPFTRSKRFQPQQKSSHTVAQRNKTKTKLRVKVITNLAICKNATIVAIKSALHKLANFLKQLSLAALWPKNTVKGESRRVTIWGTLHERGQDLPLYYELAHIFTVCKVVQNLYSAANKIIVTTVVTIIT